MGDGAERLCGGHAESAPPELTIIMAAKPSERPDHDAAKPKARKSAASQSPETAELAQSIGRNLRRLRVKHGYSLERLAVASGVSRAMLGQIELGKSVPTISLLWKVAKALGVPFSALNIDGESSTSVVLRLHDSKVLTSQDGRFTSRALFPHDTARQVEFYELEIAEGAVEHAVPHAPGTIENIVVTEGDVEIVVGDEHHRLGLRDALLFQADVSHSYRNIGRGRAVLYLVMSYAEPVSG